MHVWTRNSSGDELANVNFLYDDIVYALQNTIDWFINSVTDRLICVRTQVYQIEVKKRNAMAITPFKVIQGHRLWNQSKTYIRLPISN